MFERRGFLRTLSLRVGAMVGLPGVLEAGSIIDGSPADEPWLRGLTGKHRQFLDVGAHGAGAPLLRTASLLNAYHAAYALGDRDVNIIFGAHGSALAFVLDDPLWSTYSLGAQYGITDPTTNAPAVRNIFARTGSSNPVSQWVSGLQERGVRFLGCLHSVERLSQALAARMGEKEAAIASALVAGFLPGVTAVPAMSLAAGRAQEAGLTYVYFA